MRPPGKCNLPVNAVPPLALARRTFAERKATKLPNPSLRRSTMQPFVPCTGCGNQVPTLDLPDGIPVPQALICEACGQEFLIDVKPTKLDTLELDSQETPVEVEAAKIQPALELELELAEPGEFEETGELDESEDVATACFTEETGFTEVKSSDQPSAHDWSVLAPPIKRRRTQEVSAIRKILPPVLGGLAAFPIATLIMWYGFGKDLGSTGPTVAQYVPWIVPQKLRNAPWQYSARGSRENSSSEQRSQPSAPQPRASFPSLNRENPVDEPVDRVTENKEPVRVAETNDSVEKPSISETIAKLRTLQKEWNNTPKSDQAKMLGEYYSEVRQLSEQAAELKGRSASVWRKELESISREILSHSHLPQVIQLGALGKLPSVPAARPDDFIATVITIGDDNQPMPNASWILQEKWSSGTTDIPVEILPGAWRAGSIRLPTTCLVLGKLVASEASEMAPSTGEAIQTSVVLKVHSLLPK